MHGQLNVKYEYKIRYDNEYLFRMRKLQILKGLANTSNSTKSREVPQYFYELTAWHTSVTLFSYFVRLCSIIFCTENR